MEGLRQRIEKKWLHCVYKEDMVKREINKTIVEIEKIDFDDCWGETYNDDGICSDCPDWEKVRKKFKNLLDSRRRK